MKQKSFLESKKVVISFALVSFLFGIFILEDTFMTGNIVSENTSFPNLTLFFVGVILILCSFVLVYYIKHIVKK